MKRKLRVLSKRPRLGALELDLDPPKRTFLLAVEYCGLATPHDMYGSRGAFTGTRGRGAQAPGSRAGRAGRHHPFARHTRWSTAFAPKVSDRSALVPDGRAFLCDRGRFAASS